MGVGYNPKVVTDGLVMYLDAGNKKSYTGTGTSFLDLTSNNNNGTLVNAPTYDTTGAFTFNGASNYINCGNGTTLSNLSQNLAVSVWMKFPTGYGNTNNWNGIISKRDDSLTTFGVNYWPAADQYQWYHLHAGGPSIHTISLSLFPVNTWCNFTGCFYNLGGSTYSAIYLNGRLLSDATIGSVASTSSANVVIGASGIISGSIDEFAPITVATASIYNRLLEAREVAQNYNAMRGRFGI